MINFIIVSLIFMMCIFTVFTLADYCVNKHIDITWYIIMCFLFPLAFLSKEFRKLFVERLRYVFSGVWIKDVNGDFVKFFNKGESK